VPTPNIPTHPTRFAGKYKSAGFRPVNTPSPVLNPKPVMRHTPMPASLNPSQVGAPLALKPTPNKYTGTACLGIATLHKSNAVPVFNQQAAIDAAQMRRN